MRDLYRESLFRKVLREQSNEIMRLLFLYKGSEDMGWAEFDAEVERLCDRTRLTDAEMMTIRRQEAQLEVDRESA
jgi:hypothetical protein